MLVVSVKIIKLIQRLSRWLLGKGCDVIRVIIDYVIMRCSFAE